ncbi:MAG: hypothetical protein Q8Q38_00145 [bacterium]|nr:hypothetical protein [bacterium]
MKILEFYFNPKAKGDRFFKTLTEESLPPRLGRLYLIGELQHALPHQAPFLKKVLSDLLDLFAQAPRASKEHELQTAVRQINAKLREETKKGNVSWLGNLHLSALNLRVDRKGKQMLTVAKAGNMKVLVSRSGKLRDVDQEVKNSKLESSGVKMFSNIISGQVVPGDKVLCLTRDLFDVFEKEKLLSDLTFLSSEKQLQKLFEAKKNELSEVSGLLYGLMIEEEKVEPVKAKRKKTRNMPTLSFPSLRIPVIRVPSPHLPLALPYWKVGLVTTFFLLLGVGFLFFKGEREAQLAEALAIEERVTSLQIQAESLRDATQSNKLLQEAWRQAAPQAKPGKPRSSEFQRLVAEIESSLYPLNMVEEVDAGQAIAHTSSKNTAKQIILSGNRLYLSAPFTSDVSVVNIETGETTILSAPKPVRIAAPFGGTAVFYADPGILLHLLPDDTWQEIPLRFPYEDPGFAAVASFTDSLYFFDSEAKEIIKYANPDFSAGSLQPTIWLESETKRKPGSTLAGASLAIDGNLWIITNGKEIQRYFAGVFKENLEPLIFPFLDGITKIRTSPQLPYLYLLDPSGRRVILLTKFGEVVKQYRITGPDSITDFAVSPDGSSLYLLSGSEVYRIPATLTQP